MTKKRRPSTDDEETPSALPAVVEEKPLTLKAMKERSASVRLSAKLHYVTDPKERGVAWWWEHGSVTWTRPDGTTEVINFKDHISVDGFIAWSKHEKWATERDNWWADVELQVLSNLRDQAAAEKIEELRVMRQSRGYLTEYLFPLKDAKAPDGIKRYPPEHKWAGLPVFPLELGNMSKFIEAYLKLDERVAFKRGDAVGHTNAELEEMTGGASEKKENPGEDIARRKANDFSQTDVRAMAKAFLVQREESLKGVIDTEGEVIEDEDDDEGL